MYRVNLRNLVKNKLTIAKDWNIQPSEIDRMPYYEYEEFLEEINKRNKEEEKRQKNQEKAQSVPRMPSPNDYAKTMSNMSSKLPKVSIPNFK